MTREHGQTISSRRLVALPGVVMLLCGLMVLGCAGPREARSPKSEVRSQTSTLQRSSTPPIPRNSAATAAASESAAAAVAPQLPRTITLIWDKNDPHPDTVTEIWSDPTPAGPFTWLADAPEPQVTLPVTNAAQFFIIRNRLFNQVSDWDRKP